MRGLQHRSGDILYVMPSAFRLLLTFIYYNNTMPSALKQGIISTHNSYK